jgi:hypothetical protein
VLHPLGDGMGVVGVVRRRGRIGAEVEGLEPQRPQLGDEPLLEFEPRMIGCDGKYFGHGLM